MKRFFILPVWGLSLALFAAPPENPGAAKTEAAPVAAKGKTPPDPETEGNIAKSVGRVLENVHYSQIPLDDALSAKFLRRYEDSLDPQHSHFLQTDLDEFAVYKTQLDDLTLRVKDTKPAHKMFARMQERLLQHIAYVEELCRTEKFEFKSNERFPINRKDLPNPKDLTEAKQLWRQQLRFEYLQEKLGQDLAEKQKKDKEKALKKKNIKIKLEDKDKDKEKDKKPELTPHEEIVQKLLKRYHRMQKNIADLSADEVLEIYMNALAHVYDPHSDYMGKAQMENFNISMKLSLFGIGAVLQSDDDGYCKIMSLRPGPAMKSKQISEGDRIVAVAQGEKDPVEVVGWKLNKIVEMIRGEKNTEVRLTVWPGDSKDSSARKVVTLIRDEIKLEDEEAKAKVIDMPLPEGKTVRLGVIDLPSFYEDMNSSKAEHKSTSADIARLLKKLTEEKVDGVILDLRRNGGGALSEAIRLTGLFIKDGPVVQTKDPGGRMVVESDRDPRIQYAGPLIVLTSRFSASASEILAGALQDYGRALIVGDSSTHGKGTVQQLLGLQQILDENQMKYAYDPGALKFTIRKFYRAGGASTQLKGVVPDMILPSVNNFAEVGESALDNPLPWDEVESAKLEKVNLVAPYLAELKRNSNQRLEKDKDFAYIQEDIQRYRKNLEDKTVSLNESERVKERRDLEAQDEKRKKERLARKPSEEKVYEVKLKDVDEPGLKLATNDKDKDKETKPAAEDEEEGEEKAPAIDATLDETKRILADYIALSPKKPAVVQVEKK